MSQITELLERMDQGEPAVRDALFGIAYPELRRMAHGRLRDGGRGTVLDTTALVHETYLRFVRSGELRTQDRRAFFAYASRVMRSVIVDSVRERNAARRGGGQSPITLTTSLPDVAADGPDLVLRVHEALELLERADARLAQVVEMRYFGGYSEQEIAEVLEINPRTVQRDWHKAQIILSAALS